MGAPCYYIQPMKELLFQITKGIHLPQFPPSNHFDPSIISYLNETSRKWKTFNFKIVEYEDNDVKMIDYDAKEEEDDDENDSDTESDDDGFGLNAFPCEDDSESHSDDGNEDALLNAIYKTK